MTNVIYYTVESLEKLAEKRDDVQVSSIVVGNAWVNEHHQPKIETQNGVIFFDLIEEGENLVNYFGFIPENLDKVDFNQILNSKEYNFLVNNFGFGETVHLNDPIKLHSPFGSDVDTILGIKKESTFYNYEGFKMWFNKLKSEISLNISNMKLNLKDFSKYKRYGEVNPDSGVDLVRISKILDKMRKSDLYEFFKVYKKDIDQLAKV